MPNTLVLAAAVVAASAVTACSSTYHPEYHPVTVNSVAQGAHRGDPAPVIVAAPLPEPPPGFFDPPP